MDSWSLVARVIVILLCFPIHESAHAWVADQLGDATGRLNGRISLNPKRHLDLWGTFMIFMAGFGYAKPVPVNPNNFKDPKKGMALTAAAGPASNLIMAVLFLILARVIPGGSYDVVHQCLFLASYINISLAVFNLFPFPPLDGSKIAAIVLPDHLYNKFISLGRYSILILWGGLYLLGEIGLSPISFFADLIFRALISVTFFT